MRWQLRVTRRSAVLLALLGVGLSAALLMRSRSEAAAPQFVQGPGTVPPAIAQEGIGRWAFNGPTDRIILEGATTVRDLAALEPHIALGVFPHDSPDDPVYVVFIEGTYQRNDTPTPFVGRLGMLILDKEGHVRASRFWPLGMTPQIGSTTHAFGPAFDITTIVPQPGN